MWLGAWINTLRDVFSCKDRKHRRLLDASADEAPEVDAGRVEHLKSGDAHQLLLMGMQKSDVGDAAHDEDGSQPEDTLMMDEATSTPAQHLQDPMELRVVISSGGTCMTPLQPTAEIAAANTDQGVYVVDAKVKCWYRGDSGKGRMYVVTICNVRATGFTVMYSDTSIEHSVSRKRLLPLTSSVCELVDIPAPQSWVQGVGLQ